MTDYDNIPRPVVAKVYRNLGKVIYVLEAAAEAMPDPDLVWACVHEMERLAKDADLNDPVINSFSRAAARSIDEMRSARGEMQDVSGIEAYLEEVADGQEEA